MARAVRLHQPARRPAIPYTEPPFSWRGWWFNLAFGLAGWAAFGWLVLAYFGLA